MKTWIVENGEGVRLACVLAEREDLVWAWATGADLQAHRVWAAESLGAPVTILINTKEQAEALARNEARSRGADSWGRRPGLGGWNR